VHERGLDALGFPPAWLHTTAEAIAVAQAINQPEEN
jgi:hypothetical protein